MACERRAADMRFMAFTSLLAATVATSALIAGADRAYYPAAPDVGNAVTQSAFEGLRDKQAFACWRTSASKGTSVRASIVPGRMGAGARLDVRGGDSGNGKFLLDTRTPGCTITATAGQRVHAAAWVQGEGDARLTWYYRDAGGAWKWWHAERVRVSRGQWSMISSVSREVPAGATAVAPAFAIYGNGWVGVDDVFASTLPAARRAVPVNSTSELRLALADARAGDHIHLAAGTYAGRFTLADVSDVVITADAGAVLDGGNRDSGYVLHLDRVERVVVAGVTARNGQKIVVADESRDVTLRANTFERSGNEVVLLRNRSTGARVHHNVIADSGSRTPGYGEGVYVGLSKSNWDSSQSRFAGQPDTSDDAVIAYNLITGTTAENVDLKEGTRGGVVFGNELVVSALSGANYADSALDVAGNDYVIANNRVSGDMNGLADGFQTHVQVAGLGCGNAFAGNMIDGTHPGYALYVHTKCRDNTVYTTNYSTGAGKGISNVRLTKQATWLGQP